MRGIMKNGEFIPLPEGQFPIQEVPKGWRHLPKGEYPLPVVANGWRLAEPRQEPNLGDLIRKMVVDSVRTEDN